MFLCYTILHKLHANYTQTTRDYVRTVYIKALPPHPPSPAPLQHTSPHDPNTHTHTHTQPAPLTTMARQALVPKGAQKTIREKETVWKTVREKETVWETADPRAAPARSFEETYQEETYREETYQAAGRTMYWRNAKEGGYGGGGGGSSVRYLCLCLCLCLCLSSLRCAHGGRDGTEMDGWLDGRR